MADQEPADNKNREAPKPEVLKPQTDASTPDEPEASLAQHNVAAHRLARRGTYRPTHKATFAGLIAVVLILAINAAVIGFVIHGQSKSGKTLNQDQVTLSQASLDKLGVNRSSVGDAGVQLTIGPATQFNSKVKVAGDVSIGGQLTINSKFNASDASLAQLEAGNTALNQLNVNGDTTSSSLVLRNDLNVNGIARFQKAVTMSQLLTVNNNVNVSGSLSVGGALLVNSLHTSSLVIDSTITVGGHVITRGAAPGVSSGSGVGSNGTVSISGNDTSGTVAVNTGVGAGNGIVANVSFRSKYGNTPHVVVTPVGPGVNSFYVNRSASGFSIGVSGSMSAGGHAFDYIVEQ